MVPVLRLAELPNEWRAICTYELDGNLLVIQEVCAFKDDTERALSDLLSDAIMNANDVGG